MQHLPVLLMTRPLGLSQEFVADLRRDLPGDAPSFEAVYAPLLKISYRSVTPPSGAVPIFTSRHGVRAWLQNAGPDRGQSRGACYCVGDATAQEASAAGFDAVSSGGTAEDLIKDILQAKPQGPLVHFSGAHVRGTLTERLAGAGLNVHRVIGYDQELQSLTPEVQDLLQGVKTVIVPLFSPRTAQHFKQICPDHADLCIIAISKAAAQDWPDAVIAGGPSAQDMREEIMRHLGALRSS